MKLLLPLILIFFANKCLADKSFIMHGILMFISDNILKAYIYKIDFKKKMVLLEDDFIYECRKKPNYAPTVRFVIESLKECIPLVKDYINQNSTTWDTHIEFLDDGSFNNDKRTTGPNIKLANVLNSLFRYETSVHGRTFYQYISPTYKIGLQLLHLQYFNELKIVDKFDGVISYEDQYISIGYIVDYNTNETHNNTIFWRENPKAFIAEIIPIKIRSISDDYTIDSHGLPTSYYQMNVSEITVCKAFGLGGIISRGPLSEEEECKLNSTNQIKLHPLKPSSTFDIKKCRAAMLKKINNDTVFLKEFCKRSTNSSMILVPQKLNFQIYFPRNIKEKYGVLSELDDVQKDVDQTCEMIDHGYSKVGILFDICVSKEYYLEFIRNFVHQNRVAYASNFSSFEWISGYTLLDPRIPYLGSISVKSDKKHSNGTTPRNTAEEFLPTPTNEVITESPDHSSSTKSNDMTTSNKSMSTIILAALIVILLFIAICFAICCAIMARKPRSLASYSRMYRTDPTDL